MLLSRRSYVRETPSRDAKKIFIICEGAKREPQYFGFFRALDSRIDIIIHAPGDHENNSPSGLLGIACEMLLPRDGEHAKLELLADDEVWIVFDTDPDMHQSRKPQILDLCECCRQNNWNFAQSNPCFEVWLWYHFYPDPPTGTQMKQCSAWKNHPELAVYGGFNSRKHPALIGDAVRHAGAGYQEEDGDPVTGCTQLYQLGMRIHDLLKDKIRPVAF